MIICDKNSFQSEVLEAKGVVLVDFYGDGCIPCAELMPYIEALSTKYGDKIKFCKLNTTTARRLAIGQKIIGLPVVAIYMNGEKLEELIKDDATPEAVEAMILKYA